MTTSTIRAGSSAHRREGSRHDHKPGCRRAAGGGKHLKETSGQVVSMKLFGRDTSESVTLFEQTVTGRLQEQLAASAS
jgi:hypothetical protein